MMFFRPAISVLLLITLLGVILLVPTSAIAGSSEPAKTVAAGEPAPSPLSRGARLPKWLPRTEGELIPLGLAIVLMGASYVALRRSTGVADAGSR